jgi:hypothetical protein
MLLDRIDRDRVSSRDLRIRQAMQATLYEDVPAARRELAQGGFQGRQFLPGFEAGFRRSLGAPAVLLGDDHRGKSCPSPLGPVIVDRGVSCRSEQYAKLVLCGALRAGGERARENVLHDVRGRFSASHALAHDRLDTAVVRREQRADCVSPVRHAPPASRAGKARRLKTARICPYRTATKPAIPMI